MADITSAKQTDYSFIANPQTPDSFKTIGSMLNIAQGAQNLQKGGLDIQQQTAVMPSVISQAQSQAGSAAAKMSVDQLNMMRAHASNLAQSLETLRNDPTITPDKVKATITSAATNMNSPPEAIAQTLQGLPDSNDPSALHAYVNQALLKSQDLVSHIDKALPPSRFIETGQQSVPVADGNPALTGVAPGTPQGPGIQHQLPPTTPTFNSQTNAPGYLGPQNLTGAIPGEKSTGFMGDPKALTDRIVNAGDMSDADKQAAIDQLNRQLQGLRNNNNQIQSGPALGQKEAKEGSIQMVNNHYTGLAIDAANSAKLEGIARNIQDFAPKAISGTAEDKLSFVNGLLAQLGLGQASDLKTGTDLLQKNMAMLTQNTPAGTDAGRLITQMAQPHSTMTAEAMKDAAGQIVGQLRMSRDAFNYFSADKQKADQNGDTSGYLSRLSQFNQVADPRIWQFEDMSPPDRKAFVSRMPLQEQQQFRTKIQKLTEMGFLK